jgi:hypothetical protein
VNQPWFKRAFGPNATDVNDRKTRHDFASGEWLDLELVVCGFGYRFAHLLSAAVNRVKRLRPAAWHAPFDFRH